MVLQIRFDENFQWRTCTRAYATRYTQRWKALLNYHHPAPSSYKSPTDNETMVWWTKKTPLMRGELSKTREYVNCQSRARRRDLFLCRSLVHKPKPCNQNCLCNCRFLEKKKHMANRSLALTFFQECRLGFLAPRKEHFYYFITVFSKLYYLDREQYKGWWRLGVKDLTHAFGGGACMGNFRVTRAKVLCTSKYSVLVQRGKQKRRTVFAKRLNS